MTLCLATRPKTTTTPHQLNVIQIVIKGNESDDPTQKLVDLDQILERVDRKTSKQSMQFTIRALVHNNMIAKMPRVNRRGRNRAVFAATQLGRDIGEEKPKPAGFVSPLDEEDFEPEGV